MHSLQKLTNPGHSMRVEASSAVLCITMLVRLIGQCCCLATRVDVERWHRWQNKSAANEVLVGERERQAAAADKARAEVEEAAAVAEHLRAQLRQAAAETARHNLSPEQVGLQRLFPLLLPPLPGRFYLHPRPHRPCPCPCCCCCCCCCNRSSRRLDLSMSAHCMELYSSAKHLEARSHKNHTADHVLVMQTKLAGAPHGRSALGRGAGGGTHAMRTNRSRVRKSAAHEIGINSITR